MARRKAGATPGNLPPASRTDIEMACEALEVIKRQLKNIVSVGGGTPTAGLLLAAVDDCAEAVIVANDAAEIGMVNGAAARLTGLSTRELQSLTIWDITHPASQMLFDVLWREFRRAGRQRGDFALRHRDGHAVEVAYCAEANVLPGQHVTVIRRRTLS
jgi:PAS domain S-box-containing protein